MVSITTDKKLLQAGAVQFITRFVWKNHKFYSVSPHKHKSDRVSFILKFSSNSPVGCIRPWP